MELEHALNNNLEALAPRDASAARRPKPLQPRLSLSQIDLTPKADCMITRWKRAARTIQNTIQLINALAERAARMRP